MASTTRYNQPLSERFALVKLNSVAASTTIPGGTLAMNDGGSIKVYTAAGVAAGAKLLGFPTETITNTTGTAVTARDPYQFRRCCQMLIAGKAGDLPTTSELGGPVYLKDNFAVGKTLAAGDVPVNLLEHASMRADGMYLIQLP